MKAYLIVFGLALIVIGGFIIFDNNMTKQNIKNNNLSDNPDVNITIREKSNYYKELCSNKKFIRMYVGDEEAWNKYKDDYIIKVLNLTEEHCEVEG